MTQNKFMLNSFKEHTVVSVKAIELQKMLVKIQKLEKQIKELKLVNSSLEKKVHNLVKEKLDTFY